MAKRVSLGDRRKTERKGVDALFENETPEATTHRPKKPTLAKVTLYIRPDQVLAVETIQLGERRRTGKKPDKSDLAQEAFDLLMAKYQP